VLAHLVDVSDASGRPDPVKDFEVIMTELGSFGADLEKKPMIVAASKMDVANPDKLAKLRKHVKKLKLDLYEISAVTGHGIPQLKYALGNRAAEIRAGTYVTRKTAPRKKASSPRKARNLVKARRIPKRAAFKKRKTRSR
jgi:GTP-binding protein